MLVMAVVGDKLLLDVIIKAAVENIRSQSTNNIDFALKTIYIVHGILAETDLHPKDKSLQKKVESLKGEIKRELEKITANHELFDPYVKAASLLIAVRGSTYVSICEPTYVFIPHWVRECQEWEATLPRFSDEGRGYLALLIVPSPFIFITLGLPTHDTPTSPSKYIRRKSL